MEQDQLLAVRIILGVGRLHSVTNEIDGSVMLEAKRQCVGFCGSRVDISIYSIGVEFF